MNDPTSPRAPCSRRSLFGLCALMGGAGALHFVVPAPYRRIVPTPLRDYDGAVVAVSGLCEIGCAALLAIPRTRRLGAFATAAVLLAVSPANIQMALDGRHANPLLCVAAWLRLPLQVPLILWALRFRHR